jgi:hypothetical protein
MKVCQECNGGKYLSDNQYRNVGDNVTFTAPTTGVVRLCPTCVGVGYFTGSGS